MRHSAFTLILCAAAAAALTTPLTVHAQPPARPVLAPPMAVDDDVFAGERARRVLAAQILLDRSGHSPGVIDAMMGANTRRAIRAFAREHGLPTHGSVDAALVEALMRAHPGALLQRHRITEAEAAGPFRDVPAGMVGMSRLDRTAYESPAELLAERFHMSEGLLRALNPGADFGRAGTEILVAAPGDARGGAEVARIEIDKDASELSAYAADGTLVATPGQPDADLLVHEAIELGTDLIGKGVGLAGFDAAIALPKGRARGSAPSRAGAPLPRRRSPAGRR